MLSLLQEATADENGRAGSTPLIVVNPLPQMDENDIREILEEERAHRLQLGINGTFADHLDTARFFRNPNAKLAREALRKRGYDSGDHSFVAEIGAALIRTKGWRELASRAGRKQWIWRYCTRGS